VGDDEGPLYLSKVGVERQLKLLELSAEELFDDLADLIIQVCMRFRMRPRDVFDGMVRTREQCLEAVIVTMNTHLADELETTDERWKRLSEHWD
jgi:hypothetical protein